MISNTTFANSQTPGIDYSEIDTSWAHDCRVFNNIACASPGKTVTRNRSRQNRPEPSDHWEGNDFFGDDQKLVAEFGEHDVWSDPLFLHPAADATASDFALQRGSPARGRGIANELVCGLDLFGALRPVDAQFDCGALQSKSEEAGSAPAPRKSSR